MSSRRFYQTREASSIAFVLIMVALIYFGATIAKDVVTFRSGLQERVVDLLTNLMVLVLVIERLMEIFISTWRNPEKNVLENNLQKIDKKLEILRQGQAESLDVLNNEALEALLEERSLANLRLLAYKEVTRIWSVRAGFIIGVVLAIAGFRVLESIFTSSELGAFQLRLWTWIDILITAGVIAGGSKGIHTLSNALGDFFEHTSARLKASNPV
jgi:fumarate reductase subunit C